MGLEKWVMTLAYDAADRYRPRAELPPLVWRGTRELETGQPSFGTHTFLFGLKLVKQNILLDSESNVRLSDIGFAKLTPTGESEFDWARVGAEGCRWAAPEIFQKGEFTKQSDVFSYGFIAAEVHSLGRYEHQLP